MTLNCKPGDLAVMIRSLAGNEGKIFKCIRLATTKEKEDANFEGVVWIIDIQLATWQGFKYFLAHDKNIRPIGDNPGADESLTWKPVPIEKELA
jgi:hypothetical protein